MQRRAWSSNGHQAGSLEFHPPRLPWTGGGRILSSHFLPLNELHCESLVPVGLLEFYLTPSS